VIRQADVPGRVFSATGKGCAAAAAEGAEVTELCRAGPDPPLHAAAANVTARATAMPTPRRLRIRDIAIRLTAPHHGTAGQQTRLDVPLSPSLTW
jgi:hypothetical protein